MAKSGTAVLLPYVLDLDEEKPSGSGGFRVRELIKAGSSDMWGPESLEGFPSRECQMQMQSSVQLWAELNSSLLGCALPNRKPDL